MNPPAFWSLGLEDIKKAFVQMCIFPGKHTCFFAAEPTAVDEPEDCRENQISSFQTGSLHGPVAFPEERKDFLFRKKIRLNRRGKMKPSRRDKIRPDAAGRKIPAKLTQKCSCVIKASRGILERFKKSLNGRFIRYRGFRSCFHDKPGIFL